MKETRPVKPSDLQFLVSRKAVSYCRVSTDDQADHGTSLTSQRDAIDRYAAEAGLEIVAHFEDDFSGRKLERPGFDRARKYLQDGLANVLIVYKGDRLSRHRTHTMMIIDELQALDCELHLASKGQVDLTDDTAVLLLSIEGHLAHSEVSGIVERTTRGRREKAQQGQVMAARIPYGYRIEKEVTTNENGRLLVTSRKLVIEPEEARIVRLIFELFVYEDRSYYQIAVRLDELGYRSRKNKPWSADHVHLIIKRTAYRGDYTYAGIKIPIDPIIDAELWDRAQEKREHHRKHKRHDSRSRYLFSGRVSCFHCEYHAIGTQSRKNFYYICNCAHSHGQNYHAREGLTCDNHRYFETSRVEDAVFTWLHKVLTDKEVLKLGLADYVAEQTKQYQPMLDDLSRVDKLLSKKLAEQARLLDAYLDGIFDKDVIKTRQVLLEQEIKSAKNTKAELEQKLEKILDLPNQVKTVEQLGELAETAFKAGIPKERRLELVEALDIKIKLEAAADGLYIHATSVVGGMLLGISLKSQQHTFTVSARLKIGR